MNPIVSLEYYDEEVIDRFDGIVAWLLYSDLDTAFAKYVIESWIALDCISGDHCLISLLEKPKNIENKKYWENLSVSEEEAKKIYSEITGNTEKDYVFSDWLLKFKPYDRNVHIKIADKLNIPYTEMPCIVFYTNTTDKEYVVYSFSNDWSQNHLSEHMKGIFTAVREITTKLKGSKKIGSEYRKQVLDKLGAEFMKIKAKKFVKRLTSNASIGNVIKGVGQVG